MKKYVYSFAAFAALICLFALFFKESACGENSILALVLFLCETIKTLFNTTLPLWLEKMSWPALFLLALFPFFSKQAKMLLSELGAQLANICEKYHPNSEPKTAQEKKMEESNEFKQKEKSMTTTIVEEKKPPQEQAKSEKTGKREKTVESVKKWLMKKEDVCAGSIQTNQNVDFYGDPVFPEAKIFFDITYKFGRRRYLYVLIMNADDVMQQPDTLYRKIRVVQDWNDANNNQRYAIHLVLPVAEENRNAANEVLNKFKPAVDNGSLGVSFFDETKAETTLDSGWILSL